MRSLFLVSLAISLFFADGVAAEDPHLLLVTVDTLRADFLGCYGYSEDISPNIDAIGDEGTAFRVLPLATYRDRDDADEIP